MSFTTMGAQEYRALDHEAFEARRRDLIDALNDPDCEVPTDDLLAERDVVEAEVRRRNAATSLSNARLDAVASGAGRVIGRSAATGERREPATSEDPFDTPEYNRAFFDYFTRGARTPGIVAPQSRPSYVRADQFTTVATDVPNFVPTTMMNDIIEKAELYGELWPLLSKTNVQGGVVYNVADFDAEAKWVTETEPSEDQKLEDGDQLVFSYHMLEVKLAQSILSSVTTLAAFQRKFPEVAYKAIVKKLEQGYIRGTGSGQMLGILNDTRVPAENKIEMSADDMASWAQWHKKVKAAMKRAYRDGVFIMAQGTFDAYIDGMVDSTGQPIARVNYGINGEETYRFMGKRVMTVEDDIFADFDSTEEGEAFAVFTRPADYLVNSNMGMRSVNWVDEDTNVVKHKLQTIVDGKLLRPWGTLVLTKPSA